MLVLGCRIGESVQIGDQIEVHIRSRGKRSAVTLAIDAPREIPITRASARRKPTAVNGAEPQPDPGRNGNGRARRRVTIEPVAEPESSSRPAARAGSRMLEAAVEKAPPEVLKAVARGDAIDQTIRRALMELAREELAQRRRLGIAAVEEGASPGSATPRGKPSSSADPV